MISLGKVFVTPFFVVQKGLVRTAFIALRMKHSQSTYIAHHHPPSSFTPKQRHLAPRHQQNWGRWQSVGFMRRPAATSLKYTDHQTSTKHALTTGHRQETAAQAIHSFKSQLNLLQTVSQVGREMYCQMINAHSFLHSSFGILFG